MVVKETEYKGILFRSRLEARVALFFDKAGIEWVYEPDRVVNGDSEYNPDFYLPELDDYVEVKGKRPGYEKEILKAREHLTWGGDIKRLVIISEIPDPTAPGLPHFPCYYMSARRKDGIEEGWYFFKDSEDKVTGMITSAAHNRPTIRRFNINNLYHPFDIRPVSDWDLMDDSWFNKHYFKNDAFDKELKRLNERTFSAFAAARKADFTMRRAG